MEKKNISIGPTLCQTLCLPIFLLSMGSSCSRVTGKYSVNDFRLGVIVEQKYEFFHRGNNEFVEIDGISIPVRKLVSDLLDKSGCIRISNAASQKCDAVLLITVHGEALLGSYNFGGFWSGAKINGSMRLIEPYPVDGQRDLKIKESFEIDSSGFAFHGTQPPYAQISAQQYRMPIEAPFDAAFEDSNFKLELGRVINKRFGETAAFRYWHALMKSGREQRLKEIFWHSLIIEQEEPEEYMEFLGGQYYERLKRGIIDRAFKGAPSPSAEVPFSAEGTRDTSDLDLEAVAAKMETEEATNFTIFEEAPVPIDGPDAVQKNLSYPETAIGTGVEGRVLISVEIDIHGNVTRTTILKSMGIQEFDNAAAEAVKAVKYHPAKMNGQPVKSRVILTVVFAAK